MHIQIGFFTKSKVLSLVFFFIICFLDINPSLLSQDQKGGKSFGFVSKGRAEFSQKLVFFADRSNSKIDKKKKRTTWGKQKKKSSKKLVVKTNSVKKRKPSSRKNSKKKRVKKYKEHESKAVGVIVNFKAWPPKQKTTRLLIRKIKREGLKLKGKFSRFKSLAFSWDKIQKGRKAELLCFTIKLDHRFSSLVKSCEPDYLFTTSQSSSSNGAIFLSHLFGGFTTSQSSSSNGAFKENPIQNCSFLQSDSSHWGQQMIGADLSRELIEKNPPQQWKKWTDEEKKDYQEDVLDFRTVPAHWPSDKLPESKHDHDTLDGSDRYLIGGKDHGFRVENQIAGSGPEAVLPDSYGDTETFYGETTTDHMEYAENLCGPENKNKSCHEPPAYINRSVTYDQFPYFENCHRSKENGELTPELGYYFDSLIEVCATYHQDCPDEKKGVCENDKILNEFCPRINKITDSSNENEAISAVCGDDHGLMTTEDALIDQINFRRAIKEITDRGTILVNGAGNAHIDSGWDNCGYPVKEGKCSNYNNISQGLVRDSKELGVIVVGSVSKNGERSGFSQEGEGVTILAPGEDVVTRDPPRKGGGIIRVEGTSYSTPLVTASLKGFNVLSGYHPSSEEAKILLRKTAIPNHANNGKNGAGTVNAYKLAMVGKRLREKCGNIPECIKEEISGNEIYRFPEDRGLSEAVAKVFPECYVCEKQSFSSRKSADCKEKKEVFTRLRKASLLDPQNKKLWRDLACIYSNTKDSTYKEIASNYHRISTSVSPEDSGKLASCRNDSDCVLIHKDCGPSGETDLELIEVREGRWDKEFYALNKNFFDVNRSACLASECGGWDKSCMKKMCATDSHSKSDFKVQCRRSKCIGVRKQDSEKLVVHPATIIDIPPPPHSDTGRGRKGKRGTKSVQ